MIDSDGIGRIGNSNYIQNTQKKQSKTEGQKDGEKAESSGGLFSSEKLETSSNERLKELLMKAKLIPEVREELVEKFQKAIEDGVYKPDPSRIAKRLSGD